MFIQALLGPAIFIPFPASLVSVRTLSLPLKQGQWSDRTRTTVVTACPLRARNIHCVEARVPVCISKCAAMLQVYSTSEICLSFVCKCRPLVCKWRQDLYRMYCVFILWGLEVSLFKDSFNKLHCPYWHVF